MALVTISTRWNNLRQERAAFKQWASELSAALAAGPRSANDVVGFCQRLNAGLTNHVAPVLASPAVTDAVSDYADADLVAEAGWTPGLLKVLLPLLVAKAGDVIAECRACIPRDASDLILKDTWNEDGSVTVLQVQPADTADLRTALDALVAAIPE